MIGTQKIRINHKELGLLLDENFVDNTQFKIFLKVVNACLVGKQDLDFYNGTEFLIHIPYEILKESVITAKKTPETLTESILNYSPIER